MLCKQIITSESVGVGHPDKICDQIADLILDECLKQDENSRVACEVFASSKTITIAGEITTKAYVDVVKCAWKVLKPLGYTENDFRILIDINAQSNDIAKKVNLNKNVIGAGDQGIVYGYACDETQQYLPLSLVLSNEILLRLTNLIKNKKLVGYLYDMKSLVSIDYKNGTTPQIYSVILSVQHTKNKKNSIIKKEIENIVINPVLKLHNLSPKCKKYINYVGNFINGGLFADTGLTGRKIIVDTYGPIANHGGGAFSGKDYTKVDRTGAYFARYIAKNIVAAKLAKKVQVQLTFCIGLSKPISLYIETYGTNLVPNEKIFNAVTKTFNFDLYNIVETLG
ncbi:methionine adenosyltransferase, partial [bacterium]|nr:methionine adenosyltransferase [bacterium]